MDQTFAAPRVHPAAVASPPVPRPPLPRAGRVLTLAGGLGVLGQALFFGHAGGINVPLTVAALLGAAWLVRPRGARLDPLDAPLPPAAVIFGAAAAVRAEPMLVAGDLLLATALTLAALPAIGGVPVVRTTLTAMTSLGLRVLGVVALGAVWVLADARPWSGALLRIRTAAGPAAPVLRGVALAAPFLVVFGIVFSAADAIFARLLGDLFAWDIDPGDVPGRALLTASIAWAAAGALAVVAGLLGVERRVTPGDAVAHEPATAPAAANGTPDRRELPRLAPLEVAVGLLAIDALFLAFVVLQGTYLFGGRDTVAAAGLTYAEYARRGFGELLFAASVAGVLLLALEALVARRTRLYVASALALVLLTGAVLVSCYWRLRLYQDAYGWTELRVYVIVAIAWLSLALGAGAIALLRDRSRRLPHALAALGLLVALATTAIGPQRFSAEQNIARALDPSLVPVGGRTGLDAEYLATLGDDAVPALVAALPRLDVGDRTRIGELLTARRHVLATEESLAGWPAWNLAREEARRALGLR